jgi:hypothetical protein
VVRQDLERAQARLRAEIASFEERIAAKREEARLAQSAIEGAEVEKATVLAEEAGGDLTEAEARKRFEEAAETERRQRADQERLLGLVEAFETQLAERREEIERVQFELAVAERDRLRTAAMKSGARLTEAETAAAAEGAKYARAAEAFTAAQAHAYELCPADVDFELKTVGFDLPEGLDEHQEVFAKERKRRAGLEAEKRTAERSRREARKREDERLAREFAWSGDARLLEKISAEHLREEARRQHVGIRRRAEPQVAAIIEKLREGRIDPGRALSDLGRLAQLPDDLRYEAAREIETLATRSVAAA